MKRKKHKCGVCGKEFYYHHICLGKTVHVIIDGDWATAEYGCIEDVTVSTDEVVNT